MGKYSAAILLLAFLISYPTYCQHDLHQLLNQEIAVGVGLSSMDPWTQVGGNLYYGLSPEVTGHIFAGVRFLKEDPLLSALDIDFSPSPGVGIGLSGRDLSDGSNVGGWASGFVSRRWTWAENSIKGRGAGIGIAGGPVGRITTQSGAILFPFIGASYNISGFSWEDSDNEWDTALGGIMGMEARIENLSMLGFINFSLEGGGTSFVISSFFRMDNSKLPWIPGRKQEIDPDTAKPQKDTQSKFSGRTEIVLVAVGTAVLIMGLMFSD